jgi:hypothetical protein
MCDASDNNDDIYVDNVRITATTQASPNNYIIPLAAPQMEADGNTEESPVRIFPNPASTELNISVENNEPAELFIYDMQGHVVHHEILMQEPLQLSLEKYSTGIYMVFVITKEDTYNTRFIKK